MPFLLSVDVGTTSVKVALFDERGCLVVSSLVEYQLLTPQPEWVELQAQVYWNSTVAGIKEVLVRSGVRAGEIRAVGVTSQGETIIPVDLDGRPLRRAIVWLDNRASAEAERVASAFDLDSFYTVTGLPEVIPTWPACKLLWLREHEPEVFGHTHKVLMVEDYISYRLTDRFVTEPAVCTSTGYLDIRQGEWWLPMLDYVGMGVESFPELVSTGEAIGTLSDEAAQETGLAADTLVVTGGMDQIAGAVGAGNVVPGLIAEVTGTALVLLSTVEEPVYDPKKRLPLYRHALPGKYLLEPYCQTAGMAFRWYRDQFGSGKSYDDLVALAIEAPPGCDGLVMLPHLTGATSPRFNHSARGVFYGISLHHTQAHFVRAVLESVAFMLRENVELLHDMGVEAQSLISLGGGARSDQWLQIKADVMGIPVVPAACEETTALGVAILAAVALGIYPDIPVACRNMVRTRETIEPDPGVAAVYEAAYKRYLELYDALEDLFGR
jgi:xylulokinase